MTLNNYAPEDFATLSVSDAEFLIMGRETSAQGTPHIQGYFYWAKKKSLKQLKKLCPSAHWEPAKGTAAQNVAYCSKEDQCPFISGEPPEDPRDGSKKYWAEAKEAAKDGRLDDVPPELYVRYYRTFKEIAKDHMSKPEDASDVTGVWYYGPSGCGKSRTARETYPSAYLKRANKWWDGYQNEPNVILDDLDKYHVALGYDLKIWADRYSFLAETKGGALHIRPERFVVTSQYHPDEIWDDQETREAIKRRFRMVKMGGYQEISKKSAFSVNWD